MLPVRCYTCNKILGHLETLLQTFQQSSPMTLEPFYVQHNITRYCCRRILLTNVANCNETTTIDRTLPETVVSLTPSRTIPRIFIAR